MFKSTTAMVMAMALGAAAVLSAPRASRAQTPTVTPISTATPTTVPLACVGAKKVQLVWLAKDPFTVRLFISATHCAAPASCAPFSGPLVTTPPITVTLTDASGHSLNKTIIDPGVNLSGCPGSDTYRGSTERFRLIYGAATTLIGKLRVPQANPAAPEFTPPLKFTVRDSNGYAVEGTVSTCFSKPSSIGTYFKCF